VFVLPATGGEARLRYSILIGGLAAAALAEMPAAQAAEYPTRPIRLLVGFAAGGAADITTRAVAEKLSGKLGQPVTVENRAGATGSIAAEITARAPADGHTLLMATVAALAINPSLQAKLPFDPLRDIAAVARVVDATNILVVHPSLAAASVRTLILLARSKPLNAGSSGVGGTGHLAIELFNQQAGTKLIHVPYKGGAPAMTDLLAGNIDLIFATAASALPHMRSGRIRALAVTTARRSSLVSQLPTIAESGLKGFEANNWYGLVAPARTPAAIVQRLNAVLVELLKDAELRRFLSERGLDAAPGTSAEFAAYIRTERDKWEAVIKAAGLYHSQ